MDCHWNAGFAPDREAVALFIHPIEGGVIFVPGDGRDAFFHRDLNLSREIHRNLDVFNIREGSRDFLPDLFGGQLDDLGSFQVNCVQDFLGGDPNRAAEVDG